MNGSKEWLTVILRGPQCSRLHFYLRNLKDRKIQSVIIIHRDLVFIPLLAFGLVSFFFLLLPRLYVYYSCLLLLL